MKIESECIYEHREHGEVLVCGISTEYVSYDTAADEGVEAGTVVRYACKWDGFGALPAAVTKAPIDEFVEATGKRVGTFDRDTMDE